MKSYKVKRALQLLLLMPFTIACGVSKSMNESGSSSESSLVTTDKAIAYCSADVAGESDFSATLTAVTDAFGVVNFRYARLKITSMPAEYDANKWDLMLYRWTASATGATTLDSKVLFFHPEKKTNDGFEKLVQGGFEGVNGYQVLNIDELKQLGQYANVNASTSNTFFDGADLLVDLNDATGTYKVLRIALKDSSGSEMRKLDILIPTFYADPTIYHQGKPEVLYNLHPMRSKVGQGWTADQYSALSQSFCI